MRLSPIFRRNSARRAIATNAAGAIRTITE
jgi:hypothetical protein